MNFFNWVFDGCKPSCEKCDKTAGAQCVEADKPARCVNPEENAEYMILAKRIADADKKGEEPSSADLDAAQNMVLRAAANAFAETLCKSDQGFGFPRIVTHLAEKNSDGKIIPLAWFNEEKGEEGGKSFNAVLNAVNPVDVGDVRDVLTRDGICTIADKLSVGEDDVRDIAVKHGYDEDKDGMKIYELVETPEFCALVKKAGHDSVLAEKDGPAWIVLSLEQAKCADPVAYGENGEIIPLEKRFDPKNPDFNH